LSTTTIAITNDDSAWLYIKEALEGKYDNKVIELNFDNWPLFNINVKGERYCSTMTAPLMKSLVELQGHLYRVYAEVVYGKDAKSLTAKERAALEIVFKIEEGSSNVGADLSGFFAELGKHAMEKMTGKQVVAVVLGAAALWMTSSSYDSYIKGEQATLAEKNRHEIALKLISQQPQLLQIQNEQVATYTNILKSVPDATQVTLNDTVMSKEQVAVITKQERKTTELQKIDGKYLVTSLKMKDDRYRIDVRSMFDEKIFSADLFKGHLNTAEMDMITKAFTTEEPINLNIIGRIRGDIVTTASIMSIRTEENEIVMVDTMAPSVIPET